MVAQDKDDWTLRIKADNWLIQIYLENGCHNGLCSFALCAAKINQDVLCFVVFVSVFVAAVMANKDLYNYINYNYKTRITCKLRQFYFCHHMSHMSVKTNAASLF